MFKKFAMFWIEQPKLTRLFIGAIFLVGIISRLIIPKQYNPSIVVPAFQITIPAPGYSSQQTANLITKPLENILAGLLGVDHVYGTSMPDGASLLVAFAVGVDKEEATTRLYNALRTHETQAPLGINYRTVQSIDPDDIPIFSVALIITGDQYTTTEAQLTLQAVALDLIDQLKTIGNTTLWYRQGGQEPQVIIALDKDEIATRQVDIGQIVQAIQQQYKNTPLGSVTIGDTRSYVRLIGSPTSLEAIEQLVITHGTSTIRLSDIATISYGRTDETPSVWYSHPEGMHEALTIGVAKKAGANAVTTAKAIQKELARYTSSLPEGIEIITIQDEGVVAEETTNMLLINLLQSILIVSIVLSIFLGKKRALNVAISIPLTLSIVFLFILIIGDNINRITLFALILMLGMLVDDATVVVENISRHLSLREKTGSTKKQAILDAIGEVELGVVLSTATRLLSFVAMFFVTGMMGDYMGPIPRYAIVTMIASTTIALTINPFLAWVLETDLPRNETPTTPTRRQTIQQRGEKQRTQIGHYYQRWLKSYLDANGDKKRKTFKLLFRIVLCIIVITPISLEIFRARMLPKSNQNQIYLWVDVPAESALEETKQIAATIEKELRSRYVLPSAPELKHLDTDNRIIQDITWWIGTAPLLDFSNLFRGSQSRQQPYHLSARINLLDKKKRTIKSESFVQDLRNHLSARSASQYPSIEIRLLEDPPGPPTRATFLLEIGSNELPYETLQTDTKWLLQKLKPTLDAFAVKDIGISDDGRQNSYSIHLHHDRIATAGLTSSSVAQTIGTLIGGVDVGVVYDDNTKSPVILHIEGNKEQRNTEQDFDSILLTTPDGHRIPLPEVASIIPTAHDTTIYSDDRVQTMYLYGEMGNNSVIYPAIGLYSIFKQADFREGKYKLLGTDFYGFDLEHTITKESVRINLGGERELTMDTFRDMGGAMIIAFVAIYLIMVIQFGSFGLGGVIMISFLLGFFGVFPGYALLYLISGEYFSATSMIGVIALAGIVVGNAVLLVEYVMILLKNGNTVKMALVHAGWTRMSPILITSLTTILGATTILGDPVRSGVARAIILGLSTSALLTTIVLPIFLYDGLSAVYDNTPDEQQSTAQTSTPY